MTVLWVVLILVALVIVHELGHFVAAKLSGVRVEEFGVGYPPRALTIGVFGGTEYTINWIPFGGFVRLFGEEGEGQKGQGSFVSASRGKQAFILVAGVAMNLVAAWAIFVFALHMGIPRVVEHTAPGVQTLIANIVPASPAEAAGLHAGDRMISVADPSGEMPASLDPSAISDFVSERGGEHLTVVFDRGGATSSATVTPANAIIPGQAQKAALGVGLVLVASGPLSWGASIQGAFFAAWNALREVAQALGGIVSQTLHGAPNLSGVVGPVGLVSEVGEAAQTGVAQVLALAAFISVNLAVVNLIPIPALDGGKLVIVGVEAVRRKPVSKFAIHLLNAFGVALVLLLMIVVTYHDIARLVA
jgi:regulator of sigma E protease